VAPAGKLRVRAAAAMLTGASPVTAGGGDTRIWLTGPGPGDSWTGPGAGLAVLLARLPHGAPAAAEIGALLPDPRQEPLSAGPDATRVMAGLTLANLQVIVETLSAPADAHRSVHHVA